MSPIKDPRLFPLCPASSPGGQVAAGARQALFLLCSDFCSEASPGTGHLSGPPAGSATKAAPPLPRPSPDTRGVCERGAAAEGRGKEGGCQALRNIPLSLVARRNSINEPLTAVMTRVI